MGFRCYIKGKTTDNKTKEEFCLGKCYGYNDSKDGLMLGYTFIMNTPDYEKYRKDENTKYYNDYEIIDICFIAGGSIDMQLSAKDFFTFLDLYLLDYKKVWDYELSIDEILTINEYLKDCVSVFVEWY